MVNFCKASNSKINLGSLTIFNVDLLHRRLVKLLALIYFNLTELRLLGQNGVDI